MARILPFSFPPRRRRKAGARDASVARPAADAGTVPPANAPGRGTVLPFTPRPPIDLIGAAGTFATAAATLALSAAFLPARLALAELRAALERR